MISSAKEFVRLRTSESKSDYDRAAREEAPLEVWTEVVKNFPEMKIWVVGNKTVPSPVLELLARDVDVNVRDAVARKRNAPPEVLALLARDEDSGVRLAVAYNPKVPELVLKILLGDEWEEVRLKAQERLTKG